MNRSSSSAEQQGDANWAAGNWDHPACVGLELKQYSGSRLEWDWQNAMLLSHHPIRGSNGDDQDRKFQITTGPLGSGPRTYNGIIPTALPSNYLQHPGSMLSPEAICTFSGISSASNFHPSLHGALVANSNFSGTATSGGHGTLRPFTFDQRRHLTGVVSIDDQKRELNDVVKREAEFYAGDAHARIGLNLGVRTYFSTDDTASGRLVKRPRVNSAGAQVPLCQAEGCKADLTNAKHYHRRHKVCELHSKAATVIAHGQTQRFCQQCSRFHILSEFDDGKRSCRKRLADHNRRRRKPPQANTVMGSTTAESLGFVKKADDDQFANCRSGHQTASVATSNGQALLSAIALSPSVSLMNAKRQLPAVTGSTQEALYQYLHGVGHNGTYLSLSSLGPAGRNPENQTQEQNASHNYNGMGPSLPWLRPASSSRSDNNDSATGSLHLQHFIPNKTNQNSETIAGDSANIPAFPSSFYNLMPTESCRDISNSDWLVDRGQSAQFRINMAGSLEGHQALSRLEASTSVRDFRSGSSGQRAVLEFLQPQPTFSGTDGDDSQSGSGHQSDMKFSDLQALTPLGASMYDSNQNIL